MALTVDLSIDLKQKFTVGFTDRTGAPVAAPDGVVPQFISSDDAVLTVQLVEGEPLSFSVVPGERAGVSAEVHSVVGGDIADGVLIVNVTGGAARKQEITAGEQAPKDAVAVVVM